MENNILEGVDKTSPIINICLIPRGEGYLHGALEEGPKLAKDPPYGGHKASEHNKEDLQ